jgi:hypothetical protein
MRTVVDSITRWDNLCLTAIFSLQSKRLISTIMPCVAKSADGYYYPLLPSSSHCHDSSRSSSRVSLRSGGLDGFCHRDPSLQADQKFYQTQPSMQVAAGSLPPDKAERCIQLSLRAHGSCIHCGNSNHKSSSRPPSIRIRLGACGGFFQNLSRSSLSNRRFGGNDDGHLERDCRNCTCRMRHKS